MKGKKKSLVDIWGKTFSARSSRNEFLIVLAILVVALFTLSNFLLFNELRKGATLDDPFLKQFAPVDVTWITFLIIYSGLIIAITYLIKKPDLLILAFLSYAITAFFRIAAMYSLPLNAPENIIPLNDPFVQLFGSGNILLKDLFFSGHTSTLFLIYLVITEKKVKNIFLFLTIAVAFCVLIQHVHYTIDVIAAPFFAYSSFILSRKILAFIRDFLQ